MELDSVFPLEKTGIMTNLQAEALSSAAVSGQCDPLLLADLEGAGPVHDLESKMETYLGAPFVLAVSSGTSALHVALLTSGIGPGDEVIVSPYSWGQSVSPVLFTGATAVFADIDPKTLCLDPASVADRITDRTKAILPVHLFGQFADMAALQIIADRCGAVLIADAAHALGAESAGDLVGDITCYSLGRGKLVSGGEGGLLVTKDRKIYEKVVSISQHPFRVKREFGPMSSHYLPDDMGLNYRIHPLAALLANCDLSLVNHRRRHRNKVYNAFSTALFSGKKASRFLSPVRSVIKSTSVAYGIPLVFESSLSQKLSRKNLVAEAQQQDIPLRCGPIGKPLHLCMNANAHLIPVHSHWSHEIGSCPAAEKYCREEELWALSSLDMDSMSSGQAFFLGEVLHNIVSKF